MTDPEEEDTDYQNDLHEIEISNGMNDVRWTVRASEMDMEVGYKFSFKYIIYYIVSYNHSLVAYMYFNKSFFINKVYDKKFWIF